MGPSKDQIEMEQFHADVTAAHDEGSKESPVLVGKIAIVHETEEGGWGKFNPDSWGSPNTAETMLAALGGPVFCVEDNALSYYLPKSNCQADPRTIASRVLGQHLTLAGIEEFFNTWARSRSEIRTIVYLVSKPYDKSSFLVDVYVTENGVQRLTGHDTVVIKAMETSVRIIDRQTRTFRGTKVFRSDRAKLPATYSSAHGDIYPDGDAILDYLVSLPKQR
jgi:hypothetical protein